MIKTADKIVEYVHIKKLQNKIKNKKTVLVGGGFDILHYGHVEFLEKARAAGNFLIVLLEPDEFIESVKKRNPIHTQKERAAILSAFHFVDSVVLLPLFSKDEDYAQLVQMIQPAVIAVTKGDPKINEKKKQAKSAGGVLQIVTLRLSRFSSSKIIKHYAPFLSN